MAEQSLELDLRQETDYLQKYDAIWRRVNERIDLNSNALSLLVRLCLQNEGRLSSGKRKSFLAKGYPEDMLATVESIATSVMTGRDEERMSWMLFRLIRRVKGVAAGGGRGAFQMSLSIFKI
jgi:hypothetical protein